MIGCAYFETNEAGTADACSVEPALAGLLPQPRIDAESRHSHAVLCQLTFQIFFFFPHEVATGAGKVSASKQKKHQGTCTKWREQFSGRRNTFHPSFSTHSLKRLDFLLLGQQRGSFGSVSQECTHRLLRLLHAEVLLRLQTCGALKPHACHKPESTARTQNAHPVVNARAWQWQAAGAIKHTCSQL